MTATLEKARNRVFRGRLCDTLASIIKTKHLWANQICEEAWLGLVAPPPRHSECLDSGD